MTVRPSAGCLHLGCHSERHREGLSVALSDCLGHAADSDAGGGEFCSKRV